MANLETSYLGLKLKNPIIIASCGLTENIKSIKELAVNGASAIILKSIFEEEITLEYEALLKEADNLGYGGENLDFYDFQIRDKNLKQYLELIKEAKAEVDIPIIPSINCHTCHEWEYFAKQFEDSGADALELNLFLSPSKSDITAQEMEQTYFNIIKKVRHSLNIPISLKISPYFTNLASMINQFSETGVEGLVLFNRYFSPDLDIEKLKVCSSFTYSNPSDIALSLRWIAIMSSRINCDLAASTGIHDGKAVIKQILAGANAVQIASILYEKGPSYISVMLNELNEWMDKKGFDNLSNFKGLLSQAASADAAMYERVQFMKFFSGKF